MNQRRYQRRFPAATAPAHAAQRPPIAQSIERRFTHAETREDIDRLDPGTCSYTIRTRALVG